MNPGRNVLPPRDESCRLTVVIPAKNEEDHLGRTLAALERQDDPTTGRSLDPELYDVLVYCNDCHDGTARVARTIAERSRIRIHVVEAYPPKALAHVGGVRRAALDLAVDRFRENGDDDGVVASTDADTVVSRSWIASTLDEMRNADAVAGFVTILPAERDAMLAPVRLSYDREVTYRRLLGSVAARFDPVAHEPAARHDSFVGASFAVSARAYVAAGRLPRLRALEDHAFGQALDLIDARVRHSLDVRAFTSARNDGRVDGGFATFLATLKSLSHAKNDRLVRSPRASIEDAKTRGLLRDVWHGARGAALLEALTQLTCARATDLLETAAGTPTFGAFVAAVRRAYPERAYPDEPIQSAIVSLRRALADRMPFDPTRSRVASGAG